jgi:hypothetical protein
MNTPSRSVVWQARRPLSFLPWLLIALVAVDPRQSAAQPGVDTGAVQRFVRALAERTQQVNSARFELSGRIILTAQSRQNRKTAGKYYPARDESGDFHEVALLDFVRNRFRQDYQGFEMFVNDDGVGESATIRRVHTFDGFDMYTLHPRTSENQRMYRDAPTDQPVGDKWDVEKSEKKMPASVFFFELYPILYACGRLPDPSVNYTITSRPQYSTGDFRLMGIATIDGIKCMVIRWVRPPVTGIYCEWYADASDPARLVRCTWFANGKSNYELQIQYPVGSRVAKSWVYRDFHNPNPARTNKLVKERQYKVDSYQFDPPLADADFSPDLKPGTLISTKDGILPVASDGKLLVRPASLTPVWKYALIGGAVAVVAAATWLGRAMLRRRRQGEQHLSRSE